MRFIRCEASVALVLAHVSRSRLWSYDESISLCVQEQQDVSWKEAGRAGLAWTHEAKMKKPPDVSTQLSQTDRAEGKCSSPYNPFV